MVKSTDPFEQPSDLKLVYETEDFRIGKASLHEDYIMVRKSDNKILSWFGRKKFQEIMNDGI